MGEPPMEVANRIIFNVTSQFPGVESMKLFTEALNEMTSLDVIWDLTVMSHGQNKGVINRAIEVVIYRDEEEHHEDAKAVLIKWLKNQGLPFRLLGDVEF
jgi:hypothetical protein